MKIADRSRLQIRLNTLDVDTDLLAPVVNAAIVLKAYERATSIDRSSPHGMEADDFYSALFFAEQWLLQLRIFELGLRAISGSYPEAAKVAANSYNHVFPGLGATYFSKFTGASGGVATANGTGGYVTFPITRAAADALEEIVTTLIDSLPDRARLRAVG